MKKIVFSLALILVVLVTALIFSPAVIDAAAYSPPTAPKMDGILSPNNGLHSVKTHAANLIVGPEDVDVDELGRQYGSLADGRIVRINNEGKVETLANTGGRPLGMEWDTNGNLIVCDAFKGLLSLSPEGQLNTLVTEVDGIALGFTNDLEITSDGTIYFSDASIKYDQKHYMLDMMEARPWGRLMRYNPKTQQVDTLLDGLYFANGIALSKAEDFVLVNETYRYQITRYWISGPNAGQHDIFISNLPGFPDGISSSGRGTFWLALPTTRNAQADKLHPFPFLKNLSAKLPPSFWPKPVPYGLVLELDESGQIIRSLHDKEGSHYPFITSAQERNGALYLGTLTGSSIGEINPIPAL